MASEDVRSPAAYDRLLIYSNEDTLCQGTVVSCECELMLLFSVFMVACEHNFYFLDFLQTEHLINEDESKEIDAARRIYPFEAICIAPFLRFHCR